MVTFFKRLYARVTSYIPTRLPVGLTEFDQWVDSIFNLSEVPKNESTRFAVAVMVLHLGPTSDRKAKQYFVRALNKGAANEVANSIIVKLKEDQKKAQEKAKALITDSIVATGALDGLV